MVYEAEIQTLFVFRLGGVLASQRPVRVAGMPAHLDRHLADLVVLDAERAVICEFKRCRDDFFTELEKPIKKKLAILVDADHDSRAAADRGHFFVHLQDSGFIDHVLTPYIPAVRWLLALEPQEPTDHTFDQFWTEFSLEGQGMTLQEFRDYMKVFGKAGAQPSLDRFGLTIVKNGATWEIHHGLSVQQVLATAGLQAIDEPNQRRKLVK